MAELLPIEYLKDEELQAELRETRVRESNHQKEDDMDNKHKDGSVAGGGTSTGRYAPDCGGNGMYGAGGSWSEALVIQTKQGDEIVAMLKIITKRLDALEDALEKGVSELDQRIRHWS